THSSVCFKSARASSATCWASSRVGQITRVYSPSRSICLSSAGIRNAPVLPVPVWAIPTTSLPSRAGGIALAWIGVGAFQPRSRIPARSAGADVSSSNRISSPDYNKRARMRPEKPRGRTTDDGTGEASSRGSLCHRCRRPLVALPNLPQFCVDYNPEDVHTESGTNLARHPALRPDPPYRRDERPPRIDAPELRIRHGVRRRIDLTAVSRRSTFSSVV